MLACGIEGCSNVVTRWITLQLQMHGSSIGHTLRVHTCDDHFEVVRLWALASGGKEN